jgi:hypothetical protein
VPFEASAETLDQSIRIPRAAFTQGLRDSHRQPGLRHLPGLRLISLARTWACLRFGDHQDASFAGAIPCC